MKKNDRIADEQSEIALDVKNLSSTGFILDSAGERHRKIVRKIFWCSAQFVAGVVCLGLVVIILNMVFSDSAADLVAKGVSLPSHLHGCETVTYATKNGTAQCSKFPSMKSNPYVFSLCVLSLILVSAFLKYSGRNNRGLKLSKYS